MNQNKISLHFFIFTHFVVVYFCLLANDEFDALFYMKLIYFFKKSKLSPTITKNFHYIQINKFNNNEL